MKVAPQVVTAKSGQKFTLRSALVADAESLLTHLKVTGAESYKNLNHPAEYWDCVSVKDEENIIREFECASSKFLLVAAYDGHIVGVLGVTGHAATFIKHTATIGMSIQQEYCNSGLGTAMMRYSLAVAKQLGFHRLDLAVRIYNQAGIALYEKMGFERIGLLKDAAFIDGRYVNDYAYQKIL